MKKSGRAVNVDGLRIYEPKPRRTLRIRRIKKTEFLHYSRKSHLPLKEQLVNVVFLLMI